MSALVEIELPGACASAVVGLRTKPEAIAGAPLESHLRLLGPAQLVPKLRKELKCAKQAR